jgi:uncharacterized membrane protein YagU involved in acid resistance
MSSEVAVVRQVNVGDTLYAGAFAGMVGGVVAVLFAMAVAVATGMDILSPVRLIGATFIGASALEGGAGVIGYGLFLHATTAIAWGVLFTSILPREASAGTALVAGLVYGLIVMLVMLYVVLPVVNPVMRETVDGTTAFTISHLVYGAALALVPTLKRRFATQG